MPQSQIDFILTDEKGVPSFDPVHSDTLLNVTFMEQIVGTLVKYAWDGRVQKYVADRWEVSKDGLVYTFNLQSELTCEDGTLITADLYKQNLLRLFKLYSQTNKNIPVFENLVGFNKFRDGNDGIEGLVASGSTLEFSFLKSPDGILEYLSMPYYGFYCEANFDRSGKWLDPKKIYSSSAWKLAHYTENEIRLTQRSDWPLIPFHDSPTSVVVRMMPFSEAQKLPPVRTIIQKRIESAADVPTGYHKFLGTPTDLVSVVLSPFRNGPFKDISFRTKFEKAISEATAKITLASQTARIARSFFPEHKPRPVVPVTTEVDGDHWESYELAVVLSNVLTEAQASYAKAVLSAAATECGFRIRFSGEDRSRPGWKERLDQLQDMDIRVVRVDIGGSYQRWVVRMMFCSRLGVSFPDPSGKICKLTDDQDDNSPATAEKFELLVAEDAAVIPLFHTAFSWIVSDDLGMDHFSPTSNLLRFEAVQIK